jgi:hypothetical protein
MHITHLPYDKFGRQIEVYLVPDAGEQSIYNTPAARDLVAAYVTLRGMRLNRNCMEPITMPSYINGTHDENWHRPFIVDLLTDRTLGLTPLEALYANQRTPKPGEYPPDHHFYFRLTKGQVRTTHRLDDGVCQKCGTPETKCENFTCGSVVCGEDHTNATSDIGTESFYSMWQRGTRNHHRRYYEPAVVQIQPEATQSYQPGTVTYGEPLLKSEAKPGASTSVTITVTTDSIV